EVGNVGGAAGEDARVRGRHVGVRADDGADAAVQVVAHCDLLAGGFRVQVDKHDLAGAVYLREGGIGGPEGAVQVPAHEGASHQVDDVDAVLLIDAAAGGALGIVQGPHHGPFGVQRGI